ncbi:MAG: PadR family transcriptional regulator [Acidobacteria bacterium]|nr:PadR family transcriptional regulator [Acidobacteriota bacterium]
MTRVRANRLYGAVELLILRSIDRHGPLHGLDIARAIATGSDATIQIEEGTLYPALHRMQKRGVLRGEWQKSDKGRRARVYDLTAEGRAELANELDSWVRHTAAIRQVLDIPEEEVS